MNWIIEYYSRSVHEYVETMPVGIKASYDQIIRLLEELGPNLRLPYSRAMGNGLFEFRPKGKEGIARIFYCRSVGSRIIILHAFIKKTKKTPHQDLVIAVRRMRELSYGKKY